MKSCLKHTPPPTRNSTPPPLSAPPTPSPITGPCTLHKHVSFGASDDYEVYAADEWDRTPTDVTPKLTYQDMLELKEIQLSLPRADQLPDPFRSPYSRPQTHYLRKVPIGLLPLLPPETSACETTPASSISSSETASPVQTPSDLPPYPPRPSLPSSSPYPPRPSVYPPRPSNTSAIPSSTGASAWRTWTPPARPSPLARQPKSRTPAKFNFLPLLETSQSESEPGEIIVREVPDDPPSFTKTEPPEPQSIVPEISYFSLPLSRAVVDPDLAPTPTASSSTTPPSSSAPSTPGSPGGSPGATDNDQPYRPEMRMKIPLPKHIHLFALPSPNLAPPSPFALDASDAAADADGEGEILSASLSRVGGRESVRRSGLRPPRSSSVSTVYTSEEGESEPESSVVHTDFAESDRECDEVSPRMGTKSEGKGRIEVVDEDNEWETEMQLVELDSGEMTVRSVRVRRR
ncbi:hypothetical protein OF83DRAFT_1109145 [Amylostereum chailletii]|nr:hypothetical protein OF83DRAFT_1109145 [Amylostereum chailletii]